MSSGAESIVDLKGGVKVSVSNFNGYPVLSFFFLMLTFYPKLWSPIPLKGKWALNVMITIFSLVKKILNLILMLETWWMAIQIPPNYVKTQMTLVLLKENLFYNLA